MAYFQCACDTHTHTLCLGARIFSFYGKKLQFLLSNDPLLLCVIIASHSVTSNHLIAMTSLYVGWHTYICSLCVRFSLILFQYLGGEKIRYPNESTRAGKGREKGKKTSASRPSLGSRASQKVGPHRCQRKGKFIHKGSR